MQTTYSKLNETERVAYWLDRISYAKKLMKPWFDASRILIDQYNNDAASFRERELELDGEGFEEHTKRVKNSMVFGWIDQTIANMLDREPIFRVVPENREAVRHVEKIGSISNYYYKRTGQLRADERVTLDAFLTPYGVNKLGYTVDFDARLQEMLQPDATLVLDDPEDENLFLLNGTETLVTESQDHRGHIEMHTRAVQQPELGDELSGLLSNHMEVHRLFLERRAPDAHSAIRNESPFGIRWPSDMFHMDWMAQDGQRDARWIAFEWELPIDEVRANPLYHNTKDLEPSGKFGEARDSIDPEEEGLCETVRGMEIWVKNFPMARGKFRNMLLVVAEGHDKFLRDEEEWPYSYLDDYPVEVLSFQQGFKTWFNKPPLLLAGADSIQNLANEILDSYFYVARKQKNIWLYDPQFLNEDDMAQLSGAPDCSAFPIRGLADREHSGRIVQPLPFHAVPQDKTNLLMLAQQAFDRGAGTPMPMGRRQPDTATEASITDRRNTARENRRATLLSEYQVRKAEKFWQLLAQYQPRQLELIQPGAEEAIRIDAEMAVGRYRFTIDISSQSSALAVERSQLMALLNLFAGLTPLFIEHWGAPPNLPELARRLLVRGFNEKAAEEILPMLRESGMDQEQLAMQMMMMQQAQAGGMGGVTTPGGLASQEAKQNGKQTGQGIGPVMPDSFNRNVPAEGQRLGESMMVGGGR